MIAVYKLDHTYKNNYKKMSYRTITFTIVLLSLFIFQLTSCKDSENQVLNYFNNVELQYEGRAQEETIIEAMNDILNLSKEQLKLKRYEDYSGLENQWDSPTLIYKYFVPNNASKTLGKNFYKDVKAKEVQEQIKKILDQFD